MSVCVCVCLGAGEEERGIFVFNLPSQDRWLETAHLLSDSGDLCVWHGIIWYSALPRKTIGRVWKWNKDRLSLLRAVVGGCRVQEGANLLLFLPGCSVLCDTNLSPLARVIPCVWQSHGTGSAALGWGRSTTGSTAWARDAPPLLLWEWLGEGMSSWIVLGGFASSYTPELRRVFIIYY